MNKTRINWSKELHCCDDRNPSKMAFFSLASVVGGITLAFYLGVFARGIQVERSGYEQVDDDQESTGEIVVVGPSSTAEYDETATGSHSNEN